MTSPGAGHQQYNQREDLQTSGDHIKTHYQFRQRRKNGKIPGRSHSLKSDSDIIHGRRHSRAGSGNTLAVKRHEYDRDDHNENINRHESIDIGNRLRFDSLSIHLDTFDASRTDQTAQISVRRFYQNNHAGNFHTSAGGTGAGADDHQQRQYDLGIERPHIKIRKRESRRRHKRAHSKRCIDDTVLYIIVILPHKETYRQYRNENQQKIDLYFTFFQNLFWFSRQEQKIDVEIQTEKKHKDPLLRY